MALTFVPKNAKNIKASLSPEDPLSFSNKLQNFVSDILFMCCFISCGVLLKKGPAIFRPE